MIYYCSSCRILYDASCVRCRHCGRIISYDTVRSEESFLAEGYLPETRFGSDSALSPSGASSLGWAEDDFSAKSENSGAHRQRVSPPRRRSTGAGQDDASSVANADRRFTAVGTDQPPSRPSSAASTQIPPSPPPGFSGGWGQADPEESSSGGGAGMPPPSGPNYQRQSRVVDGSGSNGSRSSFSLSRTILVILLLLMVGLLLYLLWDIRTALSDSLSKIVLIAIAIAAAAYYLRRRR